MDTAGKRQFAPHLIEEHYSLEDALVVASFLSSFIRHADAVKIANLAQMVNVIAPVLTDGDEMLIQTIFHPFEMVSKRREGVSLQILLDGPTYDAPTYGETGYVDASVILDGQLLHVFAMNRSVDQPAELEIIISDWDIASLESAELLTGDDPRESNSFDAPENVVPEEFDDVSIREGEAVTELPPLSFVAMTFELD
ncbi:MAG: alpha-L-arabinofuranosidase C-terminal domain-containing protein, partial [Planctomycetota bacterium]